MTVGGKTVSFHYLFQEKTVHGHTRRQDDINAKQIYFAAKGQLGTHKLGDMKVTEITPYELQINSHRDSLEKCEQGWAHD